MNKNRKCFYLSQPPEPLAGWHAGRWGKMGVALGAAGLLDGQSGGVELPVAASDDFDKPLRTCLGMKGRPWACTRASGSIAFLLLRVGLNHL